MIMNIDNQIPSIVLSILIKMIIGTFSFIEYNTQ